MASKQFAAVAANIKLNKNVESLLVGNTSYLGEGVHDVTIQAVDISKIDENKLDVIYVAGGKTYVDKIFVMKGDGMDFGFQLRRLWSALIPDTTAIGRFIELAAADDKAFEMFTGMKLRITLSPGKGVQARALGNGKFAAFDVETNERVADTEEHDQIKDVYAEIKGKGLRRSFHQVSKAEVTDKEGNLAAFAKAQVPAVVSTAFSVGKVV